MTFMKLFGVKTKKDDKTGYAALPDNDLIRLMFTEADRLPMAFAQEVIGRGRRVVPALCEVIRDRKNWETEGTAWWAVVHACFLAGVIGGDEVGRAMIKALRLSEEFDIDWISEELPSIFGTLGPGVLAPLKEAALDRKADCYFRHRAMSGMAAVASRNPECVGEVFSFIASVAGDKEEDPETRPWAGMILLDFPDEKYRGLLLEMYRLGAAANIFDGKSVQRYFAKKSPHLSDYQHDWLEFYSPDEIEERQQRWKEEAEAEKKRVTNGDLSSAGDQKTGMSEKGAVTALGPDAALVPKIKQAIKESKGHPDKADVERHYALAMELHEAIQRRDAVAGAETNRPPGRRESEAFELFDVATGRYEILEWLVPLPLALASHGLPREGAELALAWAEYGEAENFLGDRAVILAEAGLKEEALRQVRQNLEQFPEDVWIQSKAGDAYETLKDPTAAEAQYREALDMADSNYDRDGVLERLIPLLEETGRGAEAKALEDAEDRRRAEEDSDDDLEETDRDSVIRSAPKVGRNDPCPCGSGKKYKKCCLGKATDKQT